MTPCISVRWWQTSPDKHTPAQRLGPNRLIVTNRGVTNNLRPNVRRCNGKNGWYRFGYVYAVRGKKNQLKPACVCVCPSEELKIVRHRASASPNAFSNYMNATHFFYINYYYILKLFIVLKDSLIVLITTIKISDQFVFLVTYVWDTKINRFT